MLRSTCRTALSGRKQLEHDPMGTTAPRLYPFVFHALAFVFTFLHKVKVHAL